MKREKKILMISFQSLTGTSGAGMARLGYYLSSELHKRGLLKVFIVSSKGQFDTPFPSRPVSIVSRFYLRLLTLLNKWFHLKVYKYRYIQEFLFDWFCTFRITKDLTNIVTTNPYLYRTFRKAKKLGIHISYIPGNCEDNFVRDLVVEEQSSLHISFTDAYTYPKRLNYYNESLKLVDEVITTFPTSYETYAAAKGKNYRVVNIEGYFKGELKQYEKKTEDPAVFNVSYLAYTVLLKGLHYLLEAWEQVMQQVDDPKLQLYIGGGIDGAISGYIHDRFKDLKQVHFVGNVTNVGAFLSDKNLFVVPSLTEGSPISALEAAECNIPVVLTRNCGVRTFFENNNGWVIPIRDVAAIKECILWAYNHRTEAQQMAQRAKEKLDKYQVENLVKSLADYIEQH
jgi:glycosyltransferase involved in cell wall biosynthesis